MSWQAKKAWFWEGAPFFRVLVPFVVGMAAYAGGVFGAAGFWVALAVALVAMAVAISYVVFNKHQTLVFFIAAQVLLACLGYGLAHTQDEHNNKQWYGHQLNNAKGTLVRISEEPIEKEKTYKLPLRVLAMARAEGLVPCEGKAIAYLSKKNLPYTLHMGDTLLIPAHWQPMLNAGNPFGFDYAAYCQHNNLFHDQYLSAGDVAIVSRCSPKSLPMTFRAHEWCTAMLNRYLTDSKARGLIQAMLLGDEVNLDPELRQQFTDTGIVHIIAISGGNVMVFFTIVSWGFFWLRHRRYLWVRYVVALPLVWFYVVMAGMSPSAIRAALMFSLLAIGLAREERSNSLNQLLATAFVLLCYQPAWLYSLGFQLSFVAVLSLILFYKPIYKRMLHKNWFLRQLASVVAASLAAEILVAPLVVYYFHSFPLMFLVANVIGWGFMSLVLLMGMAIILVSWLPTVAATIGLVTVWLVGVFGVIISWLQGLNPASFHYLLLSGWGLLVVYVVIVGAGLFLLLKQKRALVVALAGSCILLMLLISNKWSSLSQQKLVVYNAGKTPLIEYINGAYHNTLVHDSATMARAKFITEPAHIGWQAWLKGTDTVKDIFSIGGRTALILKNEIVPPHPMHVDGLILTKRIQTPLEELMHNYTPTQMVIAYKPNKRAIKQIDTLASRYNTSVHIVSRDGAWVMQ